MRIPQTGDVLTNANPTGLTFANRSHAPVTKDNTFHMGYQGNATWSGNNFTISAQGTKNYWFLRDSSRVSYCVVPCNGGGDAYVISTNYGGCEYDTLLNRQYNLLAFLHVMRGGDRKPFRYTMAQGWERVANRRSIHISKRHSGQGMKWSYSCIVRSGEKPKVYTTFLYFNGSYMVMDKDPGTTPYGEGDDAG